MNASTIVRTHAITHPFALGAPAEGGFYFGAIQIGGALYGLIKSPKAIGDFPATAWGPYDNNVTGALSLSDGRANTLAMAEAGSELAKRVLALNIGDLNDWYLPALDELEIAYRALKPSAEENSRWARSGINLHSCPLGHPYTAKDPEQTALEIFKAGGAECFEADAVYWTSTQYARVSDYAWYQYFGDGHQYDWRKAGRCRGCAVRRFKI
ncbi:MAG TPA: hypothetical protein VE008_07125 [Burkholderiales bacterium]|nr:hypothetical protein [Burkholderiales bacterium]